MYEVSKSFNFEAAHRLAHLPPHHQCHSLHGHSYRFEVVCRGDLDGRGFVVDYAEISRAVKPYLDDLDHAYVCPKGDALGEHLRAEGHKVVSLPIPATSAEHLARWLFERLSGSGLPVYQIRLHETAKTCVVYPAR